MKKSTIISILVSSGMANILERAKEIDTKCTPAIPKTILVSINSNQLPKGFEFSNNKKSYITKSLPVIGYDPYRINDCFLVELPNGAKVWKENYNWYKEDDIEIVPISPIEELLSEDSEERPEEAQAEQDIIDRGF